MYGNVLKWIKTNQIPVKYRESMWNTIKNKSTKTTLMNIYKNEQKCLALHFAVIYFPYIHFLPHGNNQSKKERKKERKESSLLLLSY